MSGAVFVGCLMDGRGRGQFNSNSSKDQRICKIPFDFPKESDLEPSVVSHAVSWLFGRLAGWLVD